MKDENTLGIGMCYFDCIIIKILTVSLEILRKTIKFPNNFEYNYLIKKLSKYNISKLLIEDMNLEDVLLHYYN